MQHRPTDQEAGGTGGAGPWPPRSQAAPSRASSAVDPSSGDMTVKMVISLQRGRYRARIYAMSSNGDMDSDVASVIACFSGQQVSVFGSKWEN